MPRFQGTPVRAVSPGIGGEEIAERLTAMQERQRREQELLREEQQRQLRSSASRSRPASSGLGGIDPSMFLDKGAAAGAETGGAAASGGGSGAAAASGGAASSGGSSAGAGGLAAFWPAAVVAGIALNENYQNNIGNREDEKFPLEYGLTGRALYKDAPGWGEKADEIIPGLGDSVRVAGLTSSPLDLFERETWEDLWDNAKRGGVIGGLLREIF